ncbi:MAG TPA: PadR family transcriptional regulator, partial [Terrimesophilobacter sp.]|nr:PadR family transcriptional regulator [Terrimesophilobacter sp.]
MTPPVFAHGHLRLYLLSLLEGEAMHGYELIQAIEDNFGGTYTPSAGTIYPRLSKLEEEGLVSKVSDGRKTVYAITDAGRAELDARRHELDEIEKDVSNTVRELADEVRSSVNDAMRSLRADLAAAARDVRDEARSAAREARETRKVEQLGSRGVLRDAEIALDSFRHDLRADLRTVAARGRLTEQAVTELT